MKEKIKGYRELNSDEIELINEVKNGESALMRMIETTGEMRNSDKRWLAIAKTDLQKRIHVINTSYC